MAVGASNTSGMAGIPSEALISRGVEQPASWAFSLPSSTHAGGHAARVLLQPPSLKQFVRSLDEKVINAMQVRTKMITLVLSKAPGHTKPHVCFLADGLQETVVNVLRFFLQGDAQSPVKRRSLVALSREVFGEYFKIVKRALADAIVVSVHKAARLAEAAACIGGQGGNYGQQEGTLSFGPVDGPHMELGEDWGAEAIVQVC